MDTVNLFFSCDDNYVPFLAVALGSLKENRDTARRYAVRVLHTGLEQAYMDRLTESFEEPGFAVEFIDIRQQVRAVFRKLHTRDYYSKATYYRLFIPEMFPRLDKCLYLDSDLVVRGDISKLYDTDLGNDLVGAAADGFVNAVEELRQYACCRLNLSAPERYFNAGILLMNLKAMRAFHFQQVFLELLDKVTFQVAQDQDYLNVICRDRVRYVGCEWNAMPNGAPVGQPQIIHYNVDCKPWHRDEVRYEAYFWDYANRSPFREEILRVRRGYTEADTAKSAEETVNLIAMATSQALDRAENRRIHAEIAKVVGA